MTTIAEALANMELLDPEQHPHTKVQLAPNVWLDRRWYERLDFDLDGGRVPERSVFRLYVHRRLVAKVAWTVYDRGVVEKLLLQAVHRYRTQANKIVDTLRGVELS